MKFIAAVALVATAGMGITNVQEVSAKPKPKVLETVVMVDYDAEYFKQVEIDAYLAIEAERIERERQIAEYLDSVYQAEQARLSQQQRNTTRLQAPVYYEGGTNAHLERIKMCESGGNYAITTNPTYRGAYQFSYSTWASVGGSGDPAAASPEEQDMRAQMLYDRSGPGQWPVCQYQ